MVARNIAHPVRAVRLRQSFAVRQDQAGTAFSRLRCTDDGMRNASRYLATVRRAMSTPSCRNRSTIASSDRTRFGILRGDHAADPPAHRLGAVLLAAMGAGDRGGEEVFQLEGAARRRHVLVGGDPADRALVHPASPRRCRAGSAAAGTATPWRKKPSCRRTISVRHLEDGAGALLQALTSQLALCSRSARKTLSSRSRLPTWQRGVDSRG